MRALSVRQPWAWLVVHGGKRIENRIWTTRFRGEFLIHAAKGMTGAEWFDAVQFVAHRGHSARVPEMKTLDRGGIVGIARLADVVSPHGGECHATALGGDWHMHAQYGFLLADVRATPFIPCQGALGLFDVPPSIAEAARRGAAEAAP